MADRIVLLVFDDVDLLDTGGPYEVFLTANRLAERGGNPAPFDVIIASPDGRPVTAYGGLGLAPQVALDDVADMVVLLVPGAIAIDRLTDDDLVTAVRRAAGRTEVVASVCTGAFVLGTAGLLDDRPFTTHFEDLENLGRLVGSGRTDATVRWVDDGDVVTSGGLSSGIAMALHLVERLAGRELAEATARQIDYLWTHARHP